MNIYEKKIQVTDGCQEEESLYQRLLFFDLDKVYNNTLVIDGIADRVSFGNYFKQFILLSYFLLQSPLFTMNMSLKDL